MSSGLASSFAALREPQFAWYFWARTVSTAGSVMAPIALAFSVLQLGHSATDLSIVLTGRTVAMVVFLLIGGVVADRFSRRAVLQTSHVLTALTQGLAAWLVIGGSAQVWELTVIETVNGAVSAFTMPAMMGIVPSLVSRDKLQQANAVLSLSRGGLGMIGPALGGVLVVTVGAGWALAVDALTYLLAVGMLSRIDLPPRDAGARSSMIADLREGWSEFVGRTWLWVIVAVFGVLNAITAGIGVLGPVIAEATPDLGAPGYGAFLSAEALGAVVMTAVMIRIQLRRPLVEGMIGISLMAAPLMMFGLSPTLIPLMVAGFIAALGTEVFNIGWTTALHEHIPDRVLSRVSSYDALGSFVAIPIGTLGYGWLASHYPPGPIMVVSGCLYACVALLALVPRSVRGLRRAPREDDSGATGVADTA